MEVDHFSHEHPLTFVENEKQISRKHGKKNIICKGCQKSRTFPLYACTQTQCSFYLHKSCAELPTEFQNPFHPHGPLTLRFEPNKSFFPAGLALKVAMASTFSVRYAILTCMLIVLF